MNEAPCVNNIEGPYNIRGGKPPLRPQVGGFDTVVADRDRGSIGSQANELSAAVEELANQISSLRSRLEGVICPHPERAEAMPCPPASTPLGQHLAEVNGSLRIQIMRLSVITDNLGL